MVARLPRRPRRARPRDLGRHHLPTRPDRRWSAAAGVAAGRRRRPGGRRARSRGRGGSRPARARRRLRPGGARAGARPAARPPGAPTPGPAGARQPRPPRDAGAHRRRPAGLARRGGHRHRADRPRARTAAPRCGRRIRWHGPRSDPRVPVGRGARGGRPRDPADDAGARAHRGGGGPGAGRRPRPRARRRRSARAAGHRALDGRLPAAAGDPGPRRAASHRSRGAAPGRPAHRPGPTVDRPRARWRRWRPGGSRTAPPRCCSSGPTTSPVPEPARPRGPRRARPARQPPRPPGRPPRR